MVTFHIIKMYIFIISIKPVTRASCYFLGEVSLE